MLKRIKSINYTLQHRKAFRKVEKELTGKVSLRGWLHDMDKVFLKIFLPKDVVSKLHRSYSHHHEKKARTEEDYRQMVIDWECARITKPDKPLNAVGTLRKFYPHLEKEVLPVIDSLGLI